MREKNLRDKNRTERSNKIYWNVPRVVVMYATARVFYDVLMVIWRGPGRFLFCIVVGALIVSLLS